ncbi:ATP-binding protein [Streptomyces sp. MBT65]|uniref:ATP-binding protein n=1 Tax=Streptomyces sp. MBT65 TaxID=1488395 RepID=UPI0027D9EC0B|nr:ATP-binding protein [Streptomyces sp. MBT65]
MEESAEAARKLVRIALATWHLDDLEDSGVLIVTELVANAVKHTNTRSIRVVISRPSERFVRIGVVDKARVIPEMVKSGDDDLLASGRGFVLIDALAERWGTDMHRWGKQVWAELHREPAA